MLEFVPKEDQMVINMLANKKDIYDNYNIDFFKKEIDKLYTTIWQEKIPGTKRTIFALKKND